MATKKSVSTAKKTAARPARTSSAAKTTTKVTTVKAVESKKPRSRRFTFARMPLVTAGIAEFIGTFLLAAIIMVVQGNPLYVGFGLVAIVMVIGNMSGAHVNPLLTVGAWVTRRISGIRALVYIVAQALGAMLAFAALSAFVGAAPQVSEQAAMFGQSAASLFHATPLPDDKQWTILAAELLGSTIFAFAVASAWRQRDKFSTAFTVGFGLFAALLIGGLGAASIVGGTAILNPAVAIALQAFSEFNVWTVAIYAVVPMIGGVIGMALNDLLARYEGATVDA